MKYSKRNLLKITSKIHSGRKITPHELNQILDFEKVDKDPFFISILKKAAVPLALLTGFLIAIYPNQVEVIVRQLPSFTNMSDQMVIGADYVWNIISEPVGKANILYHIPNIIFYSFGVLGIKKLFEAIDRKTWVDKINFSKGRLKNYIQDGTTPLLMKKRHSVLFVGKGDFIGMQYVLDNNIDEAVVVSEIKPLYSYIWNFYSPEAGYEDLKTVIDRICTDDTGEYIFFPVKDDQIFLPAPNAFDLSAHKLDILCQDIRTIERKNKWKTKRIIILGDKFHKSYVHSEGRKGKVKGSEDHISLQSISKKYPLVTIIDPTDIVLSHILSISNGREIVFRATKDGISEYKERFFDRLDKLGYKQKIKKGKLTIGYDLFEDQTEQQTLSRVVDDYYPVVLSKSVRDALVRNGYKKKDFIYVPDLVLGVLKKKASEQ